MSSSADILRIPAEIRFQCSSCGNCCNGWPVPLTQSDVDRIGTLPAIRVTSESGADAMFRKLPGGDDKLRAFTHTLEKQSDGRCQYLSPDNLCQLHTQHGPEAKPAMCRLFPYSFTRTPDGTFVYVSFASSAALFNHGALLSDQAALVNEQLSIFDSLFGKSMPDWSQLQILDGHPLSWERYTELEAEILGVLDTAETGSTLDRLEKCSKIVLAALPAGANPERLPPISARARIVDQLLLHYLNKAYLPDNVFSSSDFDVDTRALLSDLVTPPPAVSLSQSKFGDLMNRRITEIEEDLDDLLSRFVRSRIFAKFFFGPQFAHLSLLAGIHHLFFVVALIRLRAKQLSLRNGTVTFLDAAELLRSLERRLTQMALSRQTIATFEVLFSSPSRLERVGQLAR